MAENTNGNEEAIRQLIQITQSKCENDGRSLCSYFLSLALQSLEDDTAELDAALKVKMSAAPEVTQQDGA